MSKSSSKSRSDKSSSHEGDALRQLTLEALMFGAPTDEVAAAKEESLANMLAESATTSNESSQSSLPKNSSAGELDVSSAPSLSSSENARADDGDVSDAKKSRTSKRTKAKSSKKKKSSAGETASGEEKSSMRGEKSSADRAEVYTVSEITSRVNEAVRAGVPGRVTVAGEVSNLSQPGSGHWYFTLKDSANQIRCAMWRPHASRVRFAVSDGQQVEATGSLEVYGPRGYYQLVAVSMRPHGVGELELAFRQLRDKLAAEGLFDAEHKKPLPIYPFSIAVVTSPTGAAVQDILRTLRRRWPVGRAIVVPVRVQGEGAAEEIVEALDDLNEQAAAIGGVDVIILARGGGSLEDLWAFNEEIVARAIHRSAIPIVSGVGHEVDVTIADGVADVRAATPTAAAEIVTPVLEEIEEYLDWTHRDMADDVRRRLAECGQKLQAWAGRGMFVHPIVLTGRRAQELDDVSSRLTQRTMARLRRQAGELQSAEATLGRVRPDRMMRRADRELAESAGRLASAVRRRVDRQRRAMEVGEATLAGHGPGRKLAAMREALATLAERLMAAGGRSSGRSAEQLEHVSARLAGCDPQRVLKRGYAVVRGADGRIVRSAGQIAVGQTVRTELHDGQITSHVDDVERTPSVD